MLAFFKNLYASKKKFYGLILVVLIAGYFLYKHYSASLSPVRYVLAQVQKQTIISSVSGTGQVSQERTINLNPFSSGKITQILAKQGDKVKAGQTIAVVDQTGTSIALNQAKAGVASAQANYDQVLAGATSQDIALAELSMEADQQALDNANQNLITVTKQQSQAVANAQTNFLNAGLAAIPSTFNAGQGTITISGSYAGTEQGAYKIVAYATGSGVQFSVSGLENQTGQINLIAPVALGTRGLFMSFSGNFVNNDTWTVSIPNTMATNYTSTSNAYQTALTAQASALASAQSQIQSAQNKLSQDKINLDVKKQPPTDQQLQSAKASLINAQAQLQTAAMNYSNNILKSPFDGQLAQLNNQVGDQVTASTNVAVVTSPQSLAVISLNEVDVSKIKLGDKATMTFDAIDSLSITGTVVQIDNIGTVTQGVVNYAVKIAFDTEDTRIKPGMSVNVSIITDIKADVLAVPNSALQAQGAQSYVQTLDPAKTQSQSGQTGVTSSVSPGRVNVTAGASDDAYTQITEGSLKEGDTIVIQTISPTAAKSAASTATNALRAGGFGGGGGFSTVRVGGAAAGR